MARCERGPVGVSWSPSSRGASPIRAANSRMCDRAPERQLCRREQRTRHVDADHDASWPNAGTMSNARAPKPNARSGAIAPVDPDNRLVARGLEVEWERCLQLL